MKALGEAKRKQAQDMDVYSPLQAYAILRLSQAIALSKTYLSFGNKDPLLTKVLHRGLYSYFRDCQDEGVAEEAKLLLNSNKHEELKQEISTEKQVLTPQSN